MGAIPAKFMTPSAPFGTSDAINSLNSAQPIQQNPQMPLLPPGFTDPGTAVGGGAKPARNMQMGGGGGGGMDDPFRWGRMYQG